MALTVKIPTKDVTLPEADALSHSFRAHGGNNKMAGDFVTFPFDNAGENYFTEEAYALCNAHGWVCEGGMFYSVLTEAKVGTPVPVDYPDSKDAEGNHINYEDYFRKDTQYKLEDGTWLFRVVRGNGASLSDADRLIYQADLGTLLVKSEGLKLRPTEPEPEGI